MSRFLSARKGIMDKFCCGKSKAWDISKAPGFPAQRVIRLGDGSVVKGYREQDIDDYITNLPTVADVAAVCDA